MITRKKERVRRALLIGEAPSRGRGVGAWTRLARLIGLTPDEFWRRVKLHNLLRAWPGKQGKGDRFPLAAARRAAERLRPQSGRVIFAGARVCKSFFIPYIPLATFEWRHGTRVGTAVIIPHPSGVNHWYNDERNRRALRLELRSFLGLRGE